MPVATHRTLVILDQLSMPHHTCVHWVSPRVVAHLRRTLIGSFFNIKLQRASATNTPEGMNSLYMHPRSPAGNCSAQKFYHQLICGSKRVVRDMKPEHQWAASCKRQLSVYTTLLCVVGSIDYKIRLVKSKFNNWNPSLNFKWTRKFWLLGWTTVSRSCSLSHCPTYRYIANNLVAAARHGIHGSWSHDALAGHEIGSTLPILKSGITSSGAHRNWYTFKKHKNKSKKQEKKNLSFDRRPSKSRVWQRNTSASTSRKR